MHYVIVTEPNLSTSAFSAVWQERLTKPTGEPVRPSQEIPSGARTPSLFLKNPAPLCHYLFLPPIAENAMIDPVNVKDYGALGDGHTDDTTAIQAALDASSHVLFPAGQYRASTTGFTLHNDQIVEFIGGASIKLLPHNTGSYQIFRIDDVSNVTMICPNLDGSRELNSATTGEFGLGIRLRGAKNIRIIAPRTTGCWGDGIYIGESITGGLTYCQNIIIQDHYSYFDRRQGLSIISGKNVTVTNPIWDTVSGTAPARGCDIEPNNNGNFLENIKILYPRTLKCDGAGIGVSPKLLAGSETKSISVDIVGHYDDGSLNGAATSSFDSSAGTVSGSITWINPTWNNAKSQGFVSRNWGADGPSIRIINPTIANPNTSGSTSPKYGSPFVAFRDTNDLGNYDIGALSIEGATVLSDADVPQLFNFQVYNGNGKVRNVAFIDPQRISAGASKLSRCLGQGVITDRLNAYSCSLPGITTLGTGTYAGRVISSPAIASTYTLANNLNLGNPDFVIECGGAQLDILPPPGGRFVGHDIDERLRCSTAGSYTRLRVLNPLLVLIVERVGDWVLA